MRTLVVVGVLLCVAGVVAADYWPTNDTVPAFDLLARPHGDPTQAGAASLAGSRIAIVDDGTLVIDADSGELVKTNARGAAVARVAVAPGAGQMVYDAEGHRAYVADRRGDRVIVVDVADRLEIAARWPTPAEPFGIALTPDRRSVLVTAIADRALVALDSKTGAERWRIAVAAEPRGVAIAPDGARAVVASLMGAVDVVELGARHRKRHVVLAGQVQTDCERCADPKAESVARAAFAVQFLGSKTAMVAYQRVAPRPRTRIPTDRYGGSRLNITRHISFLEIGRDSVRQVAAQTNLAEPRALAYDAPRDVAFVVGMGNDVVQPILAAATARPASTFGVRLDYEHDRCGADGVAVAGDGRVWIWCALSRSVISFERAQEPRLARGPVLAETRLTPDQHAGFVEFHSSTRGVSHNARASCASCHLDEGRSDGVSWRIGARMLQTPLLAGVADTAPYKWSGGDADLRASLRNTVTRLGGRVDDPTLDALAAYIRALPAVRPPSGDRARIARGKEQFESYGCPSCHEGSAYTDRAKHSFGRLEVDTPSLRGLAASAPYFHDGTAPTLDALLRGKGTAHRMMTKLPSAGERRDLIAFLQSL